MSKGALWHSRSWGECPRQRRRKLQHKHRHQHQSLPYHLRRRYAFCGAGQTVHPRFGGYRDRSALWQATPWNHSVSEFQTESWRQRKSNERVLLTVPKFIYSHQQVEDRFAVVGGPPGSASFPAPVVGRVSMALPAHRLFKAVLRNSSPGSHFLPRHQADATIVLGVCLYGLAGTLDPRKVTPTPSGDVGSP